MPSGAFVLKWRSLIRSDTCRTRSYTCRAPASSFGICPLYLPLFTPLPGCPCQSSSILYRTGATQLEPYAPCHQLSWMILLVIHTFYPVLHGWMQFPWIPDDPLIYVWLLCGFLQPLRSIAQPPPNYVKRVYIPMHSVQPSHWMVEITSSIYTFLHVPCYPSIGSLKSCPESIRSCTFCATLPIIL